MWSNKMPFSGVGGNFTVIIPENIDSVDDTILQERRIELPERAETLHVSVFR